MAHFKTILGTMIFGAAGALAACSSSTDGSPIAATDAGSGGDARPACATDADCAHLMPATTPANCAVAKCDALAAQCSFVAKDADGDGHPAAACQAAGAGVVKAGDDCNDNDPGLYPGHPETCSTAQGMPVTWPTGAPTGSCQFGHLTCLADGTESPCTGTVAPAPRDCASTLDNDCDGKSDATECACSLVPTPATQPCFTYPAPAKAGNGPCKSGTQTCTSAGGSAAWGTCVGEVGPAAADTCEPGDDSNCNGIPNEGCPCIDGTSGSCATELGAKGACGAGTTTCVAGKWSACSVQPAAHDTCDSGNDASCNGVANEGCSCINGATSSCNAGDCNPSTVVCAGGSFPGCPAPVVASGSCSFGTLQGACSGTGTVICNGSGGTACQAPAGIPQSGGHASPAPNGSWDWDCDGTVENTQGDAFQGSQIGDCGFSQAVCVQNGGFFNTPNPQNNQIDNCGGQIARYLCQWNGNNCVWDSAYPVNSYGQYCW